MYTCLDQYTSIHIINTSYINVSVLLSGLPIPRTVLTGALNVS